jgi:hypothetical protein
MMEPSEITTASMTPWILLSPQLITTVVAGYSSCNTGASGMIWALEEARWR